MSIITAICTHGQAGRLYSVGSQVWGELEPHDPIASITRFQKSGPMAEVEWFLVVTDSGTAYEVNGTFVEYVKEAGAE